MPEEIPSSYSPTRPKTQGRRIQRKVVQDGAPRESKYRENLRYERKLTCVLKTLFSDHTLPAFDAQLDRQVGVSRYWSILIEYGLARNAVTGVPFLICTGLVKVNGCSEGSKIGYQFGLEVCSLWWSSSLCQNQSVVRCCGKMTRYK